MSDPIVSRLAEVQARLDEKHPELIAHMNDAERMLQQNRALASMTVRGLLVALRDYDLANSLALSVIRGQREAIEKAPHAMHCALHTWETMPTIGYRETTPPLCTCWRFAALTAPTTEKEN